MSEERQLTADNLVEVADWVSDTGVRCDQFERYIMLGGVHAFPGDRIIRDGEAFRIETCPAPWASP